MNVNANEWDIQAGDIAKAVSRDGIMEAQVDASGPQGPVLSLHEVPEGIVVGIPLEVARALIQAYDRRAAPARSSGGTPVVIPRERAHQPWMDLLLRDHHRFQYQAAAAVAAAAEPAPTFAGIGKSWTITTQTPADNRRGCAALPASPSRAVATDNYGHVVWVAHQHDPPELVFESREDDIGISAPLPVVEQVLAHHHLVQAAAAVAKEHSATGELAEPLFPGLLYPDPDPKSTP